MFDKEVSLTRSQEQVNNKQLYQLTSTRQARIITGRSINWCHHFDEKYSNTQSIRRCTYPKTQTFHIPISKKSHICAQKIHPRGFTVALLVTAKNQKLPRYSLKGENVNDLGYNYTMGFSTNLKMSELNLHVSS